MLAQHCIRSDSSPTMAAVLRARAGHQQPFCQFIAHCVGWGLIREYRIGGDGPMLPSQAPGTEEWLQKLGSLPWMAQPGERWMYHVSVDVLGVLIARVSGQSLGTFMRERIFEPLGMNDTAFWVPA